MPNMGKIISIILGLAAIIWAYLPGSTFYPGGFGISDRAKPIPKWLGRLWFTAVGLLILYFGLAAGIPLLAEKIIMVGLGLAVIVNGFGVKRSNVRVTGMTGRGSAPSVPKRFGGLLFLIVGLLFILAGLALKR